MTVIWRNSNFSLALASPQYYCFSKLQALVSLKLRDQVDRGLLPSGDAPSSQNPRGRG